jgi:hypothetical protein
MSSSLLICYSSNSLNSVSVISIRINESFWFIALLLVYKCIKFLFNKGSFMTSMKLTLNMLHILLGLKTVSFFTCRCTLQVLSSECFTPFINLNNTSVVLLEYFNYIFCQIQWFLKSILGSDTQQTIRYLSYNVPERCILCIN